SKKSLADAAQLEALEARLAVLNPRAPRMDGDASEAASAAMLANGLYDPATKSPDVGRWLQDELVATAQGSGHHHHDHGDHHHHGHHHHHDVNRHGEDIRSFSLVSDRPIDPAAIDMFVDLLRSAHGEKLLRMKAVVA